MNRRSFNIVFVAICVCLALPVLGAKAGKQTQLGRPMLVGVCDVGYKYDKPNDMYNDKEFRMAFDALGFQFLDFNFWGDAVPANLENVKKWAAETGHGFLINSQSSMSTLEHGDPNIYRKPGRFFHPSREFIKACAASPHFMGVVYDELEHGIANGVVWGNDPVSPRIYDAEGDTLDQAYEGNLHNLQVLMDTSYPGFADNAHRLGVVPVVGAESVFPVMYHMFARAGITPMYKLLKETLTPVAAAMAMGAAKQYGIQYSTTIDFWDLATFPGHTPADTRSAFLFSYWTGAERTYVETMEKGTMHKLVDGKIQLTPRGEAVRWFNKDYLPTHPRTIIFEDFSPEIIIVRFEDSDYGQVTQTPWMSGNLYHASNLSPDDQTRYWIKIWNVISHGLIPPIALNGNIPMPGFRYRFFIPANNVAVYDETASDPKLYSNAKLVFLTGKKISPECLATLTKLVEKGLTVVTPTHLAPKSVLYAAAIPYAERKMGRGRWIITDDVMNPAVKRLIQPYLGQADEMRYVFGKTEVVFEAPKDDSSSVGVVVHELQIKQISRYAPKETEFPGEQLSALAH